MTDIVERLRDGGDDVDNEAADEIERLRANADSLWQDVQRADEANKQLADEIERLRARIRELETIFLPDRLAGGP